MEEIFSFSEATSIGLHTCIYLAKNAGIACSNKEIAEAITVSYHHLTKIVQRLVRYGIVRSQKGVRGGISLLHDPATITLWDIYIAIEGYKKREFCIIDDAVAIEKCVLGSFLVKINKEIATFLQHTSLQDFIAAEN